MNIMYVWPSPEFFKLICVTFITLSGNLVPAADRPQPATNQPTETGTPEASGEFSDNLFKVNVVEVKLSEQWK